MHLAFHFFSSLPYMYSVCSIQLHCMLHVFLILFLIHTEHTHMTDPTQCPAGNSVTQMELCWGDDTTIDHLNQKIIPQTGDRVKGVLSTTIKYIVGET